MKPSQLPVPTNIHCYLHTQTHPQKYPKKQTILQNIAAQTTPTTRCHRCAAKSTRQERNCDATNNVGLKHKQHGQASVQLLTMQSPMRKTNAPALVGCGAAGKLPAEVVLASPTLWVACAGKLQVKLILQQNGFGKSLLQMS